MSDISSTSQALAVEAKIGTGAGRQSVVTITRPSNTTAYTAADVIGQADSGTPANAGSAVLTFSSIGPANGGLVMVLGAELTIGLAAVTSGMSSFRLHLYTAAPTDVLDNAAYDLPSGDRTKYAGFIPFGTPNDLGATIVSEARQINKDVMVASGGALYGILETVGGYTPASGTTYRIEINAIAL